MGRLLKVFMKHLKITVNVILIFNPSNLNSRINLSFEKFKGSCGSQVSILIFLTKFFSSPDFYEDYIAYF